MRFFVYIKKLIFRDLYIKVSLFTLLKILSYYKIIINDIIKPYIKFFTTTMRLSYIYIIKQRISKEIKILKFNDIYIY